MAENERTIPSLYTAEEVCKKLPRGLKDCVDPDRLRKLSVDGFAPHVNVDIHPEPVFEYSVIRNWIGENLLKYSKGRPLPPNHIHIINKTPKKLTPKDFPEELRPMFQELSEYSLGQFPPCVYFLVRDASVVYVGQSTSLPSRIAHHLTNKDFNFVYYMPVIREKLTYVESAFIKYFKPEYNGVLTHSGQPDMEVISQFIGEEVECVKSEKVL